MVREAAPIPTIVTGRGRSRHSRPPTPLGTPGVRHPPRVLALDSSRYRNVPPTRIQQTPCSIAPARAAYNGPDAWGSNSSRKPTRDRWGASSGYEASGTHTDFDEIPIDQGGRSCRQAPGASSEKSRHVAHRRRRVRWGSRRRADGADLRLAVMSAVSGQTALSSLTVTRASQPRERLASSVSKR